MLVNMGFRFEQERNVYKIDFDFCFVLALWFAVKKTDEISGVIVAYMNK